MHNENKLKQKLPSVADYDRLSSNKKIHDVAHWHLITNFEYDQIWTDIELRQLWSILHQLAHAPF